MRYQGSLTACVNAACHCLQAGATKEIIIVAAPRAKYYKLYDVAAFKADEDRLLRLEHRIVFHGTGGELRMFILNTQLNLWVERLDREPKKNLPTGK